MIHVAGDIFSCCVTGNKCILWNIFSLSILTTISRYQNVSTLDFLGGKGDGGGDNGSYKMCKILVKSPLQQTNTQLIILIYFIILIFYLLQ